MVVFPTVSSQQQQYHPSYEVHALGIIYFLIIDTVGMEDSG